MKVPWYMIISPIKSDDCGNVYVKVRFVPSYILWLKFKAICKFVFNLYKKITRG